MTIRRLIAQAGRLHAHEGGATAVEYALIAALLAVLAVGAFVTLGNQVDSSFNQIETSMENAGN
ncbi:Flp family type IVb pilin [Alteraurantiacibacter palmitatis]|uniref:Flp family type IVb pilin n=1 Tax=Alteraurantiacibacter palmitatis TaxID=2054628 RepID=A0ABV7E4H4_9SPHN